MSICPKNKSSKQEETAVEQTEDERTKSVGVQQVRSPDDAS